MRIAITGANGFLGSHLVKTFLNADFKVIALVRENAKLELLPTHEALTILKIDYSSDESIIDFFLKKKSETGSVNYFIHNIGITVSTNKKRYFEINSTIAESVLKGLNQTQFLSSSGNFIYISSFAAHGPVGIDKPVSNYGRSKAAAEKIISKSGLRHLIVRPTAIYGEGDSAFLPLFKIASKGLYLITAKSNQKLTFIYAKDLSSTILENKDQNGIIHVSNKPVYLHEDIATTFEEITGRRIVRLKIPTFLVKILLRTSDLFCRLLKISPSLTLEKFNEISKDWNCNENPDLFHTEIKKQISLKEGFENTMNYYKANQLIK